MNDLGKFSETLRALSGSRVVVLVCRVPGGRSSIRVVGAGSPPSDAEIDAALLTMMKAAAAQMRDGFTVRWAGFASEPAAFLFRRAECLVRGGASPEAVEVLADSMFTLARTGEPAGEIEACRTKE